MPASISLWHSCSGELKALTGLCTKGLIEPFPPSAGAFEPSINFLALFPWKPDKDSISTMLLGNIAYGKNDPIGKLRLGWKEL